MDSVVAGELSLVTDLVNARGVDEIERSIGPLFGDGARLFAVGHGNESLAEVFGDQTIPLTGGLRHAVLSASVHTESGTTWIPVPERRHVTFVLATPTPADAPERDRAVRLAELLGPVMATQRRRFQAVEARRRRADMSIAAELQWGLLPASADEFADWAVAGALEPAYEVAGDLFDYGCAGETVWAYSFDGMGHGTEATLTGSVALAAVRNARNEGAGLDEQMSRAGAAIHGIWGGNRFVTGVACRLDRSGISYVNAGHEPVRRVEAGVVSTEELEAELPLGVEHDHSYRIQHRSGFDVGDGVALFSDGVTGATSSEGMAFGPAALEKSLADSWGSVALLSAQSVVESVMEHIGSEQVRDDITVLLAVRRNSSDETC
jgi:hypothetical protein